MTNGWINPWIFFCMRSTASYLTGIVSRDECFFAVYNIKYVLSEHTLMDFTIICFHAYEIINLNFQLAPLKILTSFENPFSNPLQRP
jgi:hypothetical protein